MYGNFITLILIGRTNEGLEKTLKRGFKNGPKMDQKKG